MSLLDEVLEARELGREAAIAEDFDVCVSYLKMPDSDKAWTKLEGVANKFKALGFKVKSSGGGWWSIFPEKGDDNESVS